jgi:hypothetical protein
MDVYGLGGLLAYLLTGRHLAHDAPDIALPPDCPTGLSDIVARARHDDPARRYADAADFKRALVRAGCAPDPAEDRVIATVTRPVRVAAARPAAPVVQRRVRPADSGAPRQAARRGRVTTWQRHPRHYVAFVIACVAVLLLVGLVLPRVTENSPGAAPAAAATTMPDVRAQTLNLAVERLAQQGLRVTRVEVIYGPGPPNQVVAQQPEPGTDIDDDEIVLIVRTGS